VVGPFLADARDIDGGQFEIRRHVLAVAGQPCRLVGELDQKALDDAAVLPAGVTLDAVVEALEAVDLGFVFHKLRTHQLTLCANLPGSPARLSLAREFHLRGDVAAENLGERVAHRALRTKRATERPWMR
jgi:hypothetical protein